MNYFQPNRSSKGYWSGICYTSKTGQNQSKYPQVMAELFEDILSEIIDIKHAAKDTARIYDTHKFWVGDSAQKIHHNFKSKVVPQFNGLLKVVITIYNLGTAWIEEAIKFEHALVVQ